MERHGCSINIPASSEGERRRGHGARKKGGLENICGGVGGLEKILPGDQAGKSDADLRWMSLRLSLTSYQG